jgi:prepilin-type N-terminal cleavage/methylation domain-containing protein
MEFTRSHRAFTLIELLVVLAIITVITMVVITSQNNFNRSFILANTAYDVALTLRYTETYGVSSRTLTAGGSSATNTGYGLHFSNSTPGSFILFADVYPPVGSNNGKGTNCHPAPSYDPAGPSAVPGDCIYESSYGSGNASEEVQTYNLGNGVTIANFCAQSLSNAGDTSNLYWWCSTSNGNELTSLDIVFSRPNPVPYMSENGLYPDPNNNNPEVTAACLELTSPQGGDRYIYIGAAGQIDATATSCP